MLCENGALKRSTIALKVPKMSKNLLRSDNSVTIEYQDKI